jgi:hypothetical protein
MAVEIHNESQDTLVWERDELSWGEWTDPWYPSRATPIPPGGRGEWRCEGDFFLAPTTGTEARAWYRVDGDPNRRLYVHVNSPLVESQYGNTFHVWAPPGYAVAHSGGQGHEGRLIVRFRPSARRAVPGFLPSENGFAFSNDWSPDLPAMTVGLVWNRLLGGLGRDAANALGIGPVDDNWLPFTHADTGLCGGMVFAVMDYFAANRRPPAQTVAPVSADDPLFTYIRGRLLDSFDIGGMGHRWLGYSSPHYPNGDEGVIQAVGLARGRSWVTYRDEWPRIREDIDAARLSPLGLVQTDTLDIGSNHQVLAYAYQQDGQGVRLWIYDPNEPGNDDVQLAFDVTDTAGEVHVQRSGYEQEPTKRIFAIFRSGGYVPRPPFGGMLTARQALARATGRSHGRLPNDVGRGRPMSLRGWLTSA